MRLRWCTRVMHLLQDDVSLDESCSKSLDLCRPVFTWWMLPDIFGESYTPLVDEMMHSMPATPSTSRVVIERTQSEDDETGSSDEDD